MENNENSRVLSRSGARLLSNTELDAIGAAFAITNGCTFNPKTCHMDFDCEPPIRCPL